MTMNMSTEIIWSQTRSSSHLVADVSILPICLSSHKMNKSNTHEHCKTDLISTVEHESSHDNKQVIFEKPIDHRFVCDQTENICEENYQTFCSCWFTC